MTDLLARIMRKVRKDPDGCWVWTGRRSGAGYGRISVRGRERSVHRAMFMLHGRPVFKDEHLDHLCRNRACCNPDHLEPVTPAENTRRGMAGAGPRDKKGRWRPSEHQQ